MRTYAIHFNVDGTHAMVNVDAPDRIHACNLAWFDLACKLPDAIRIDFTRIVEA